MKVNAKIFIGTACLFSLVGGQGASALTVTYFDEFEAVKAKVERKPTAPSAEPVGDTSVTGSGHGEIAESVNQTGDALVDHVQKLRAVLVEQIEKRYAQEPIAMVPALLTQLKTEKEQLNSDLTRIKESLPKLLTAKKHLSSYGRYHGACMKTHAFAAGLCRDKENPQLQNTLQQINMVGSAMSSASVFDACSGMGKAMRIAQMGLTAYTTSCSAARAACNSSCYLSWHNMVSAAAVFKANKNILAALQCEISKNIADVNQACSNVKTSAQNFDSALQEFARLEFDINNEQSVAKKNNACDHKYGQMILNAGLGIIGIIQQGKAAQACNKKSDGTVAAGPALPEEKCKDPKNADQPDCICMANPRTVGCATNLQKPGEYSASNFGNVAGSNTSGASADRSLANTGGPDIPGLDNLNKSAADGGGGGGVPAPTGGGSPLGGGGLNGGGGEPSGGVAEKKGLSADVLGSAGGGGGGGSGSWGGYGSASLNEKYRPFLPGGEKDPNKGLAGQQQWLKEVTGQSGRSNWEKVKQRYDDNRNTLIGI